MVKRITYFTYKFYKPLAVFIILMVLNFVDGLLIDLLLPLFKRILPELGALFATLGVILLLSVVIMILAYKSALHIKPKIFPSAPACARKINHDESKISCISADNTDADSNAKICTCTLKYAADFSGAMKYEVGGNMVNILARVVKQEDGYGLLRLDVGIPGHYNSCAFRLNYCPQCGGRFVRSATSDSAISGTQTIK